MESERIEKQGSVMWRPVWRRPFVQDEMAVVSDLMMCASVERTLQAEGFTVQRVFSVAAVELHIRGRRAEFRQAMRVVPEYGKTCPAWYQQERQAATLQRWNIQEGT